jgi:hypothetical protein
VALALNSLAGIIKRVCSTPPYLAGIHCVARDRADAQVRDGGMATMKGALYTALVGAPEAEAREAAKEAAERTLVADIGRRLSCRLRLLRSITILLPLAAAVVGFAASAIAGDSEDTLGRYLDFWKIDRTQVENYVRAEQDGMMWLNVYLQSERRPQIYCPPEHLSLTGRQIIDMLRRTSGESPELLKSPLGFSMLATLRRTFPCP